jgi:hypothetical protein
MSGDNYTFWTFVLSSDKYPLRLQTHEII